MVDRYVVLGAGAVGCGLGGLLSACGARVRFLARGEQLRALRENGLELSTPTRTQRLPVDVHSNIHVTSADVILLAVKTQDAEAALDALSTAGTPDVPIVCAQNGVAAERFASERFSRVYGMLVFVPATFLEPGKVALHSSPIPGALELGCHPSGTDALTSQMAADFARAGFRIHDVPDVMRWKYGKLLGNLESAVQALVGRDAVGSDLVRALRAEAVDVLRHAGIAHASQEEMHERYAFVTDLPVHGQVREGGSSWQSLARKTGSIESDWLNGEIVRVAERHCLTAPLNHSVNQLALRAARERWEPGALTLEELERHVARPA